MHPENPADVPPQGLEFSDSRCILGKRFFQKTVFV